MVRACSIIDPNFAKFVGYRVDIDSNAQLNSIGPSKTEAEIFQSTELLISKQTVDNDRCDEVFDSARLIISQQSLSHGEESRGKRGEWGRYMKSKYLKSLVAVEIV